MLPLVSAFAAWTFSYGQQPPESDSPYDRLHWFYDQRAFPNDTIKQGYLLKAYAQDKEYKAKNRSVLPLQAEALSWIPIGPAPGGLYSGRVPAIAVHPADGNIVYIGAADGGVWKTTNGGSSWNSLTDNVASLASGALAIDKSNPNIIYWGTGEPYSSTDSYGGIGVLKSIDGGATWTITGLSNEKRITRIAINPSNPDVLLASTWGGIYRSSDGGGSWTKTSSFSSGWDVAIDPSNPSVCYAGASGVYKSTDGGFTWSQLANGLPASTGRLALAVSPSLPSTLYVLISNTTCYKSTDAGLNWTSVAIPSDMFNGQGWYDITVGVSPTNPDIVLIGGVDAYSSSNGGSTWTRITSGQHPDCHLFAFGPGVVYLGTDGGVNRSTDNGSTFTRVNGNLAITQFYSVGTDYQTPTYLWGGTQDNGTQKTTGPLAWSVKIGGDGGIVNVDRRNSNVVYAEGPNGFHFRTINGGGSFLDANSGISGSGAWVTPVVLHPDTSSVLYTATSKIYRSADSAKSWQATAGSFPWGSSIIRQLAIPPASSRTIYASPGSAIFKSTDAGVSWVNVTIGLPGRTITSIVPHPSIPSLVYLTVSGSGTGHVFKSTDGGGSWASINGNFPTDLPVNSIAPHPTVPNTLYIGTDLGIWSTSDGGATWLKDDGFPNTAVLMLGVTSDNYLVAGTHGRSMFKSQLVSGPSLALTSPNGGETWIASTSHAITWVESGILDVKLEYSTDNGSTWNLITGSTSASSGTYSWTVPKTPTSLGLVRVSDAGNPATGDVSNAAFTIALPPSVTLTSPNGGESWNALSVHNITWTYTSIANVKIEYSTDNGTSWTSIISSTAASAGAYAWTVPNSPTLQALARISDAANAATNDVSNAAFSIIAVPTVTVTAPNGGESWQVGTTHNITWSSSNIANVKIEYSTNNGSTWTTIVSSTSASTGSYGWLVPNTPSLQSTVRISDASNATTKDVSNDSFTVAAPPSVTVTSPNGGESWNVLSMHNITWTSTSISNVNVEYSTDNGTSWTTIVASASASLGTYAWTVPNTPTAQGLVGVSDASNTATNDVSNGVFSLVAVPAVAVTAPNGGESWQSGTTQNITWTSSNVTNVNIEYSTNNGSTWNTIVLGTAATTGSYGWLVPNAPTPQALVRISDASNSATSDVSNAVFTIALPPSVTVTSPNGGESWNVLSVHSITWMSTSVSNIRLDYSTDNGSSWTVITTSTAASTGLYAWTVPNTPTSQALVRASDASNIAVMDSSNALFAILAVPTVTVTAPNGGESWQVGATQNTTWTSSGIANVRIEYSTDNGTSWSVVTNSTPASSATFAWVIPNTPTTHARVRISDASNPTVNDVSNTAFSITAPTGITVASPNGGEIWNVATSHMITWIATGTNNVRIKYSTNNGSTWSTIVSNISASKGSYQWTVPNTPTTQARVQVGNASGTITDVSDAAFTIFSGAAITVATPNGGEVWYTGTAQNITWSSAGVTTAKIEYSTNAGSSWITIISSTPDAPRSYAWNIPNTPTGRALARVSDAGNPSTSDASDSVFTIAPPPSITLLAPDGGDLLAGGRTYNVRWQATSVDQVRLEYSTDNGELWFVIEPTTPANASAYVWSVPSTPTTQALVRVSDLQGLAQDQSKSVFEISALQFTSSIAGANARNERDTLILGAAHGATASIDTVFGEQELPPRSDPAVFDLRWIIPGTQGTKIDIRDTLTPSDSEETYTCDIQAGQDGIPVTLAWNLLGPGVWRLQDAGTHGALLRLKMRPNMSVTISDPSLTTVEIVHRLGRKVTAGLSAAWNLLSLPLDVTDNRTRALFPTAISPAFGYEGQYVRIDTLALGGGFWLKFAAAETTQIFGDEVSAETLNVRAGWNLIGAPSNAVDAGSLSSSPPGIVSSQFFGYNGSYLPVASLFPSGGFWVRTTQAGSIFLPGYNVQSIAGSAKALKENFDRFDRFDFEDAAGKRQTLYLSDRSEDSAASLARFALPPLPPQDAFDIRYTSQRFVERIPGDRAPGTPRIISLQGIHFPLTLHWNLNAEAALRLAMTEGQQGGIPGSRTLRGTGRIKIENDSVSALLIERDRSSHIPDAYRLAENFPNPFNPATVIRYALSSQSAVRLTVLDLLGREVATLVNEMEDPGEYSARWDASAAASGVYFYRLTAVPLSGHERAFESSKKMLFIR